MKYCLSLFKQVEQQGSGEVEEEATDAAASVEADAENAEQQADSSLIEITPEEENETPTPYDITEEESLEDEVQEEEDEEEEEEGEEGMVILPEGDEEQEMEEQDFDEGMEEEEDEEGEDEEEMQEEEDEEEEEDDDDCVILVGKWVNYMIFFTQYFFLCLGNHESPRTMFRYFHHCDTAI